MAFHDRIRPVILAVALLFFGAFAMFTLRAAPPADAAEQPGPKIIAPADRIVIPRDLQIVTGAGPEGHVWTEVEIRTVVKGMPGARVWMGRLEKGDLTSLLLRDGSFEPEIAGLEPWTRYAIRARHGTAAGFTAWGPDRVIRTDDGSSEVFDESVIGEIRLDIPPASWQAIDDEALTTGCMVAIRDYYSGDVTIESNAFPGSGIRAKGGCGSSRKLDGKTAFKANLSWDDPAVVGCPETRRYKGLKKLTLNNQVQDPSYAHERVGYDFLSKLGIPVPRVAPVRVIVNGDSWGLYLNVETIDRRFLSRRFDSNDGMLYEGDYGCDLGETACYEPKFDTDECDEPRDGDPTDMRPLQGLHNRLSKIPSDDFYPAINEVFDFDAYLTTWAAGTLMGYFDGYPSEPTNYRIYHDPSDDRWTLIPTGIDQLFEKNVDPFDPVGLLSVRCLADTDCRAAYRQRLSEVITEFEKSDYPTMVRSIKRQMQSEVEVDARREFDVSQWRTATYDTIAYMRRRPSELRELLAKEEPQESNGTFQFRALTDPEGKRFAFITWSIPGDATGSETRWLTAKGYFDGLSARLDAIQSIGSSTEGVRAGTVIVDFVDCHTANFTYTPDDPTESGQQRSAPIDSEIWRYCD